MHFCLFFFFNDPATTEISPLSLHDALPISRERLAGQHTAARSRHRRGRWRPARERAGTALWRARSEEHTSELQSPCNLVCRLLLEKKKIQTSTRCEPSATEQVYACGVTSVT